MSRRRWLLAILLSLPVFLPYMNHALRGALDVDQRSTGFLFYEGRYYVANAEGHLEGGTFHPTYGNPCSAVRDTPRIFVQPLSLLLACGLRYLPIDPGWLFALIGLAAAVVAIRLMVAIVDELVGIDSIGGGVTLLLAVWGGGLFALFGGIVAFLGGRPLDGASLFAFDPFDGWWCLNFGRNLILPTEAVYHALTLGAFLAYWRGRYGIVAILLILLSASHPFTGVQVLTAALAYLLIERVFMERRDVNVSAIGVALLLFGHVWYYLGFLSSASAEQRSLMDQWAFRWEIHAGHLFLAYALVAILAVTRLRTATRARDVLVDRRQRFLLVFWLVSFVLANHEFLMKPMQPIHFTHGYLWTPLFLLGAPTLQRAIDRWIARPIGRAMVCLLSALFLLDNATWITWQSLAQPEALFVQRSDDRLFERLNQLDGDPLLISDDLDFAYSALVYTERLAWCSHINVTPFSAERQIEQRRFFDEGVEPSEWADRDLVIVRRRDTRRTTLESDPTAEIEEFGDRVMVRVGRDR